MELPLFLFNIVKEGSSAWENRKEVIGNRELYDKDTRVRELKSKLKRSIRKMVAEPRLYHQLQLLDVPIIHDEQSMCSGLRIDKNAIFIEK